MTGEGEMLILSEYTSALYCQKVLVAL